jgi:hypothetical protein
MHVTRDLTGRCLQAAPGLKRACITIAPESKVTKSVVGANGAGCCQLLALGTDIDVALVVEGKIVSAQRAVRAPGLVDDRNVRRDLLLVDQPIERRR